MHPIFNMISLTISLCALQVVWSFEMGYGSPMLLSMGLSKSLLTLVWLAGPLSGLIVQPLMGRWSDQCQSLVGRRRPFLSWGSVAVCASLFWIAFMPGLMKEWWIRVALCVLGFYLLDFSINVVQTACRALIVDQVSVDGQQAASAWASFMIGLGNIIGYGLGFIDLEYWIPMIGWSQAQLFAVLCALILIAGTSWTVCAVQETPWVPSESSRNNHGSGLLRDMGRVWWGLPRQIHILLGIQFFSWFGWFPFLFFSSEYIKEWSPAEKEKDRVRAGSFMLMLFSVVFMLGSTLIPYLSRHGSLLSLKYIWMMGNALFALLMLASWFVANYVQACVIVVSVGLCFSVSIVVPFALLGEYMQAKTVMKQSAVHTPVDDPAMPEEHPEGRTAATGQSTSRFTANSSRIRSRSPRARSLSHTSVNNNSHNTNHNSNNSNRNNSNNNNNKSNTSRPLWKRTVQRWFRYRLLPNQDHETAPLHDDETHEMSPSRRTAQSQPTTTNISNAEETVAIPSDLDPPFPNDDDQEEDEPDFSSGTLLGIHNIYVVLPQLLASMMGSLLFYAFGENEPTGNGMESPLGIARVWMMGGLSALIAMMLCLYL